MNTYLKASCRLSDCGKYRYTLSRMWEQTRGWDDTVAFLMLNPSTATGEEDDPTIRRCVGFAKSLGFKRLVVVNLFAYRATDPQELRRAPRRVGAHNDDAIAEVCSDRTVICAWGSSAATVFGDRPDKVMGLLKDVGARTTCFGKTASGWPRHPLYLPNDAKLEPYP